MKMKRINGKPFSIPITKANTYKKSIDGYCYGSGDIAIIFSNMDTNEKSGTNIFLSN